MDYRKALYLYIGNLTGKRGMGSYLYYREALEEKGVGVLGLFLQYNKGAWYILGERLGVYISRDILVLYSSYYLWLY